MIDERPEEPVEVMFFFGKDKRYPLRFRWKGDVIQIDSNNGYWMRHIGNVAYHYYAVSDEIGNYYELELNCETLKWRLMRYVMEVS